MTLDSHAPGALRTRRPMTKDDAIRHLHAQANRLLEALVCRGHDFDCSEERAAEALSAGCTCGLRTNVEAALGVLRQTSRRGAHWYPPADAGDTCAKCGERISFRDPSSRWCDGDEGL